LAKSQLETFATVTTTATPRQLGEHLTTDLAEVGWKCGKVDDLGTGVAFELIVNKRSLLVVVGDDPTGTAGCVVAVGRGMGPISRLLGANQDVDRIAVVTALDRALHRFADVGPIAWLTEEAWAANTD